MFIRIVLLTGCALYASVIISACGGSTDNNSANNIFMATYKSDRNNDGVVDAVYQYSYDVNENEIKVEIDLDNDGFINETCCYDLTAVVAKKTNLILH